MSGYKVFQNGDILDANTDVNPFLMRQTVMVFDDAADRTAQLDGDELEGMVTYLKDVAHLQRYDGSEWVAAAGLVEIVTFTADADFEKGDYPWLRAVRVRVVGGGGAGGGTPANLDTAGGGGAAGAYAESVIAASALDPSEAVTIGEGGAGVSDGNGIDGTASIAFGITAGGGGGGFTNAAAVESTASGGQINVPGSSGGVPVVVGSGFREQVGGSGGANVLAGSIRPNAGSAPGTSFDGLPGLFPGGGGSGAISRSGSAQAGGAGADGLVIVELYA